VPCCAFVPARARALHTRVCVDSWSVDLLRAHTQPRAHPPTHYRHINAQVWRWAQHQCQQIMHEWISIGPHFHPRRVRFYTTTLTTALQVRNSCMDCVECLGCPGRQHRSFLHVQTIVGKMGQQPETQGNEWQRTLTRAPTRSRCLLYAANSMRSSSPSSPSSTFPMDRSITPRHWLTSNQELPADRRWAPSSQDGHQLMDEVTSCCFCSLWKELTRACCNLGKCMRLGLRV
jgi:hypothetical protein